MTIALIIVIVLAVVFVGLYVRAQIELRTAQKKWAVAQAQIDATRNRIAALESMARFAAPVLDDARDAGAEAMFGDTGTYFDPRERASKVNAAIAANRTMRAANMEPGRRLPGTTAQKMDATFGYHRGPDGEVIRTGASVLRPFLFDRPEIANTIPNNEREKKSVTHVGDAILDLMEDGP